MSLPFLLFISLFIHLQAWSESYPLLCGLAYKDAHSLAQLSAPHRPPLASIPGQSEFEGITFSCPRSGGGAFQMNSQHSPFIPHLGLHLNDVICPLV